MNPDQQSPFNIVNALSLLIVIGYAGLMPMWIFFPPLGVPEGVLAIINQMMGAWGMAFGTVIAFHLGSSKSAKDAQESQRSTVASLGSAVASTAAAAATTATTAAVVAGAPANGAKPIAADSNPRAVGYEIIGEFSITPMSDGTFKVTKNGLPVGTYPTVVEARAAAK